MFSTSTSSPGLFVFIYAILALLTRSSRSWACSTERRLRCVPGWFESVKLRSSLSSVFRKLVCPCPEDFFCFRKSGLLPPEKSTASPSTDINIFLFLWSYTLPPPTKLFSMLISPSRLRSRILSLSSFEKKLFWVWNLAFSCLYVLVSSTFNSFMARVCSRICLMFSFSCSSSSLRCRRTSELVARFILSLSFRW